MTLRRLLTSTACIAFFATSAFAADPAPAPVNAKAIEPIIRDYILNHPEVIMEAMVNFQKKKEAMESKVQIEFMNAHKKELFDDAGTATVGPKMAKNVVVEFFDYNCGACKVMFPGLDQLIKEDKNLKVVFKEFPIFGDRSVALAKIGHAVYRIAPTKYLAFHEKMMGFEGRTTEMEALQFASQLGIDISLLKKEAEKPEIAAQIALDRKLAQGIGANGTPTLIVNGQIVGHALELDGLKERLYGTAPTPSAETPEN